MSPHRHYICQLVGVAIALGTLGWFIIGIFNPYLIQFYHTPASLITKKQVILIVFKINKFEIREPYVIQVSNSI